MFMFVPILWMNILKVTYWYLAQKKPLMSKKCLRNLVLDDPKLGEIYYKNYLLQDSCSGIGILAVVPKWSTSEL